MERFSPACAISRVVKDAFTTTCRPLRARARSFRNAYGKPNTGSIKLRIFPGTTTETARARVPMSGPAARVSEPHGNRKTSWTSLNVRLSAVGFCFVSAYDSRELIIIMQSPKRNVEISYCYEPSMKTVD